MMSEHRQDAADFAVIDSEAKGSTLRLLGDTLIDFLIAATGRTTKPKEKSVIKLDIHNYNKFLTNVRYPNGRSRAVRIGAIFEDPRDTLEFLIPIVDAANALVVGTQRTRMKGMAALGKCLRNLGYRAMPTSEGQWQRMLDDSYANYLLNEESSATLKTRLRTWRSNIVQPLRDIQDRGLIIPMEVKLPQWKGVSDRISDRRRNWQDERLFNRFADWRYWSHDQDNRRSS